MPNGQTEYEKWYYNLPGWLRGLASPPIQIAKAKAPSGQIAQVAPKAYEVLAKLTPEQKAGLPYPIVEEPVFQRIAREKSEKERAEKEADEVLEGMGKVPPYPTEPPPAGFKWTYDGDANRWVPEFAGLTAQQRAQEALKREQLELQRQQQAGWTAPTTTTPTDAFGRTATWNTRLGQWDYPPNWGQRPVSELEPISPYQQEYLGLQEQQQRAQEQQFQQQLAFQQQQAQMAQAEQERQYKSQLAAQPMSWLQYAAYTGQEPVVQPWMIPLGFQNTGGAITPQGFQIGQPLPGFEGQQGQREMQTFANLPQLGTPSAQLQSRWGPTAQAQYLGYQQARTGATPEETQFRLWSQKAPAGQWGGFTRFR